MRRFNTTVLKRCRSCGGIRDSAEPFEVSEACSCPTRHGRTARSRAAAGLRGDPDEPADLAELMSDPGVFW